MRKSFAVRMIWNSIKAKRAHTVSSFLSSVFLPRILVVEFGLPGLTSTSRSSRTTCSKSLALLRSSDSVLSVRPHILWSWTCHRRNGVRFPKRPHDSFRVPSGVPVQRSISERDVSYPSCFANLPPQRLSSLFSRGHRRFVEGCLLKHLLVMWSIDGVGFYLFQYRWSLRLR